MDNPIDDIHVGDIIIEDLNQQPFCEGRRWVIMSESDPVCPNGDLGAPPHG